MSSKKRFLTYALGTLVIGVTLGLTAPVGAENSTTTDSSTQPHLKSWSNIIPNFNRRFVVLADFSNQAVLDRETGLVWEQASDATNRPWTGATSSSASSYCANKMVGGTAGWRLPSVVELKSVQNPSLPAQFVPLSIFTGVQSAPYWSATAVAWDPTLAWHVYFHTGLVDEEPVTSTNLAWCVRGPMNADAY
jgi:Protein of unknown function (DUF1566)